MFIVIITIIIVGWLKFTELQVLQANHMLLMPFLHYFGHADRTQAKSNLLKSTSFYISLKKIKQSKIKHFQTLIKHRKWKVYTKAYVQRIN